MGRFRHSRSFTTGTSRSRLIIGLLILTLFLVLGLAWQASRTMQTNSATVTRVLKDYARLVAEEYSRRAMGEVGYYGYYAYINVLRQRALEDSDFPFRVPQSAADSPQARASRLVKYLFFIDVPKAEITTSDIAATGVEDFLLRRFDELLPQAFPESGFQIEHVTLKGRSHTFVISKVDDSGRFFGFAVNRAELTVWLRRAFEKDVLLPKALAGGAITNEYIYLRFVDDGGHTLLESRPDYDPYLLVVKTLDDEYEGIFRAHTINTAIDPAIAESLVIGGLPRSRLPVLLVVIILTVGLLITAIRQLLREHALMKMRTDFVSEVSHELRTPLTQIHLFTETLLFERFRSADDKRRALEIINRESKRLIHLVENVLQFSDRPGDQRKLNRVDSVLAPLIERVVEEFQPLVETTGTRLEVSLDRDLSASVDNDALRQILLNLLDNAIKYGPAGQSVQIELRRQAGNVRISVTDQGPGIPRGERERIWGGYYRLNRERRSAIAGAGIGLAVVRELVARHGGKTWVEGSTNNGACFIVEFPAATQHDRTAPEKDPPPADMAEGAL